MQVETYEIEEQFGGIAGTTPEIEAEAIKLIEKLSLGGQKQLVVAQESSGQTRIPYPEMSTIEERVYAACYPVHDDVNKYSIGIIPLRILQVIAHWRELMPNTEIQVWHDKVRNPDPVLIAKEGYSKKWLLARWGEALVPFEELRAKAHKLLIERWKAKLTAKKNEAEQRLAIVEAEVVQFLMGEYVSDPF